ncbi:hypothetical protein LINPERPRIM_LOCUS35331 [Linum perenne]
MGNATKSIARCFYLTRKSFNATREPEYYTMFELVARHGPSFKPPSCHDIRETRLNEELEEVEAELSIFRNEWTKVGCSIMSDGWKDRKQRLICSFLVNITKGIVFTESLDTSQYSKNTQKVFEMLDELVEKVGEENVLQIIIDNASAYKAVGAKLMEKRQHHFWTPCEAHCLDLALWWVGNIRVNVLSCNDFYVDLAINEEKSFFLSCVHAPNDPRGRATLWDHLGSLRSNAEDMWVVIGDFNAITNNNEKLGGRELSYETLRPFNDFIFNNGLLDMGYKEHKYTRMKI